MLLFTQGTPPNDAPTARKSHATMESCYYGELQQNTNMAKLKMAHWVTLTGHRTLEDCFQHPPFPLQISADQKQTRHTTINLIIKMQAILRSLIEDY